MRAAGRRQCDAGIGGEWEPVARARPGRLGCMCILLSRHRGLALGRM
jgi:hypothetical protein